MKEIDGFETLKLRYLNGNRKVKDEILKSLEVLHGYHRKSAIRLLNRGVNNLLRAKVPKTRGRKPRYQDKAFVKTLRKLWSEMEWQCARNMKPAIPRWLPAFEEEFGRVEEDVRSRLLSVSDSTISRLLKPYRVLEKRKGGTHPSPLRNEIPITTRVEHNGRPGHIEVDTVAHCGGDMSGRFMWSFTATDVVTGWTEVRSVWAKGMAPIIQAFQEMRNSFPFPILSFHSDNGGEFINRAMFLFLQRENIPQSRSRAYEKNDNAHVEQKNRTHVRNYLGEMRIDNPELSEALDEILRDKLSVFRNLFFPTRKLISKVQAKGVTYKTYDQPRTPLARVLASPFVSEEVKKDLRLLDSSINPIKLRKQLRSSLRQVLRYASVTSNYDSSATSSFGNTEL